MNSLLAAKMAVCALLIFCGAKPLPVAPSETAAPSAVQASAVESQPGSAAASLAWTAIRTHGTRAG